MRIVPYTLTNTYCNNKNAWINSKKPVEINFGSLNFQSASQLNRLKEFTNRGYKLASEEINVISPDGINIKGAAFIKDKLNQNKQYGSEFIDIIITDNNYIALGEVHCSCQTLNNVHNILVCSLRNYTNKYNLSVDFMEPKFEAHEYNISGKYRNVGTGLYNSLVKYIKENHPQYEALYASIRSQGSWNFHTKYGFTMNLKGTEFPAIDDYDPYCPSSNYLFYRIK